LHLKKLKGRPDLPTGTTGAIAELVVAADLLKNGWSVFRSVSPHAFCDLVACKESVTRKIEVRTGSALFDGSASYSKKIAEHATEFAIYIPETGAILYIGK